MDTYKYAVERLEPYPFKIRHELRKNMTNLPERWKAILFSNDLTKLEKYVDERHRIIDWTNLEIIINHK